MTEKTDEQKAFEAAAAALDETKPGFVRRKSLRNRDVREVEARVLAGQATQEDARKLVGLVKHYKARVNEVESHRWRVETEALRKVADVEFLLRLARGAVDPAGHGLNYSQSVIAECVLDPSRITKVREAVAEKYLEALKWMVPWEERERKERERVRQERETGLRAVRTVPVAHYVPGGTAVVDRARAVPCSDFRDGEGQVYSWTAVTCQACIDARRGIGGDAPQDPRP